MKTIGTFVLAAMLALMVQSILTSCHVGPSDRQEIRQEERTKGRIEHRQEERRDWNE